ncbi:GNAT family N-acetyltransferase [Paenibacillus albiflavus]|uniref:GNAT family N-acetyltransferase n=1 Tax=Paenibacillus albiflavus TaxID=2545760 RepID=A0A4R4E1Q8_9BACL|nr:GNAT family N-acetyltransferase [Paenibacillus albiflavus]TCZ71845.1 GNAT family N-acetyltransferase [Paenibacillus albiflavus]
MDSIIFRQYKPGDEQQLVSLWNEVLTKDPITSKRFRNLVLLDANFDPEGMKLAFEGDKLIGCVYAIRRLLPMVSTELETDNGWIPFFFVASEYRQREVGSQLLKQASQFLREQGRKKVFFASYAPNYIVPGIDAANYPAGAEFLRKNGFMIQYSAVAMDKSLVDYELLEDIKVLKQQRIEEGYTFEQAKDADLVELIRFSTQVFNADWGRAIRERLLQGLAMEQILIARANGELIGFCLYGGYEGIRERFGPFGVHPSQQGKGIGKILLHDCLKNMRSHALHNAWFLWTGETSSAGHLYKKAGFEITRRFDIMFKNLF